LGIKTSSKIEEHQPRPSNFTNIIEHRQTLASTLGNVFNVYQSKNIGAKL
jgi:hypothetical protein